jgi:hypothetical protein
LRSNTTSEVSRRVDDLAKEDENLADLHSDDSASSIVSSSFQGTETNSVQDGVASEDAAENLLIQSSLSNIEKAIDRLYQLSFMICQISKSSSEDETPWLAKEENNSACRNEMTHYFENQNRDTVRLTLRHQENIGTSGISVGSARHMVDCCFPDAPEFLRAKLSNGIVIRRKRFLYREHHQKKLFGVDTLREDMRQDLKYGTEIEETDITVRASKAANELSPVETLAPKLLRPKETNPSHTSASALQNQSLLIDTVLEDTKSNQTTAFTATPSSSAPIELPRPPKPVPGSKEFECPYCCLMLPIKESRASHWRYVITNSMRLLSRAGSLSPSRLEVFCTYL